MRLALAFAVLVVGALPASANDMGSHTLAANHVGCRNPQDLIDFVRMGKQAQGDDQLLGLTLQGLLAKFNTGDCHQFTKGTPITFIAKKRVQDFDIDCIKDDQQSTCYYTLDPAS